MIRLMLLLMLLCACDASTRERMAVDAAASDGGTTPDCPAPEGSEAPMNEALILDLPEQPAPDLPFALGVRTESGAPLTTAVRVCADGVSLHVLQLYRGRGSVSLTLPEGELLLQAAAGQLRTARRVKIESAPVRVLYSALPEEEQRWLDGEVVQVSGVVQLPAAGALTIEAGAKVLFDQNASLEVLGRLEIRGTAERPVLLTRAGAAAWGGIRLLPGASATIEHAWFVGGGGDRSLAWGHSRSQPVVWVERAQLVMRGGGLIDNPGKAFGADHARVELDGVLVSRCDTGGEFAKSELHLKNGHILELPDADGERKDDDNDGIYISGAALDASGQPIESRIEDTVFAVGEDDAIDHNNGQLRVERVWIERFANEGIAASRGHRVVVSDSVVRATNQGIEAGYGAPQVIVEHTLLTDNQVGLRYGDDYAKSVTGTVEVSHSIIRGNQTDVRNYVNQLAGPRAGAIQLSCSVVSDEAFTGANGNVDSEPDGPWQSSGCAEGPALCEQTIPGPRCP